MRRITHVKILAIVLATMLYFVAALPHTSTCAQELLDGEFADIELGRDLLEPKKFPTIQELRKRVADPEPKLVMMLKLHTDAEDAFLPVWSPQGDRLAFQIGQREKSTSKLLLFRSLADDKPQRLTNESGVYDFMFRWGVNGTGSFAFARIDPQTKQSQIITSTDGEAMQVRTRQAGQFLFPTMFARTDGIFRLAYEQKGEILHQAWQSDTVVEAEKNIATGTWPRWSRNGYDLLLALPRTRSAHDLAIRNLRSSTDTVIASPQKVTIRSPMWSPMESHVAFYARERTDSAAWQLRVADIKGGSQQGVTVASDVVVNSSFESEGPSFEPSGVRLWFFSNAKREQAYHPLVAVGLGGGTQQVVDYPKVCTNPLDIAVNPVTATPEIAFVGRAGASQDLFVVLLNHY